MHDMHGVPDYRYRYKISILMNDDYEERNTDLLFEAVNTVKKEKMKGNKVYLSILDKNANLYRLILSP